VLKLIAILQQFMRHHIFGKRHYTGAKTCLVQYIIMMVAHWKGIRLAVKRL